MLEIFIPTKIKDYSEINIVSDNFINIIRNNYSLSPLLKVDNRGIFQDLKIEHFESTFFEGIKIKSDIFLEDLIILCNGEFGEFYFLDFDYIENKLEFNGTKIIGENKMGEKISEIMLNIAEITGILNSDTLLTNSKKEIIKNKIDSSFFALSGVIFLLYGLKNNTEKNLKELESINGKVEFEGQVKLLSETSITKKIELEAGISKLEGKIELFIGVIKSLIK